MVYGLNAGIIREATERGLWLLGEPWMWCSPKEAQSLLDDGYDFPGMSFVFCEPLARLRALETEVEEAHMGLRSARRRRQEFVNQIKASKK